VTAAPETLTARSAGARVASAPDADVGPFDAAAPEDDDLDVVALRKAFTAGGSSDAGRREILRSVDFRVRRGESVALVGANGAGKSTLLRCCLRLIEPDGGNVFLLGEEMALLRGRALRRVRSRTGFVFQRHHLVGRLTALSNVVHGALGEGWFLPRAYHALAPRDLRERAAEALRSVGMLSLAGRRADRLSGGESQRVAIARALVGRPRILFADEPAASLDPHVGEEVMDLFREVTRRDGVTLVFSTHHLPHALRCADRVLGLRDGRIGLDAPSRGLTVESLRGLYG